MVSPVTAIKLGFTVAIGLNELFGDDPMDAVKAQLDQLLQLSQQLLTNVETVRQTVISGYMSGVHSDIKQSLNYWASYDASGNEATKQLAISKSMEALSDITSFSTLAPVEKVALTPLVTAANALRLRIMDQLQDGATSGELKGELNSTIADLESILTPLFDEVEQTIVIKIAAVDWHHGFPISQVSLTLEFLTSTSPVLKSTETLAHTFLYSPSGVHPGHTTIDGMPDWAYPEVGDVFDTSEFLDWVIAQGIGWWVDASLTGPVARVEYDRAGGNDLEALIAKMKVLTSGTWHQGRDGPDDDLLSDQDPGYDKPDTLDGKGGDDLLYAGNGNDTLRGGSGNDTLLGQGGNDVLRGGADDDRLHGGDDDDIIDGGTGTDTVVFTTSGRGVSVDLANRDKQNTRQGQDTITNVENLEGSHHIDTLRGDDTDNIIRGHRDGDALFGRDGDDTLDGGDGADVLDGGDDIDTAVFDDGTSSANVDLAETGRQDTVGFGRDVLISIENITSGAGTDSLKGDGKANTLKAGAGNDTLEGRLGNDILDGGGGTDTALFSGATAITADLGNAASQATGLGNDKFISIENLTTDGGNDRLTGSGVANRLLGGAGNDILNGGAGDDVLSGQTGIDTALFTGSAAVTVDLTNAAAQTTGHGNDTLSSIENVTSGEGADSLKGSDLANTLIGNGGNDRLEGGLGDDSLDGGAGVDTAVFGGVGNIKVKLSIGAAQDTGLGRDTLAGIENLISGGGNDALSGDGANNRLISGAGDDRLNGGLGNDVLLGGRGKDTAVFTGGTSITLNLASKAVQNTGHGNDKLVGIEHATTGGGADKVKGTGSANVLITGGGRDKLFGLAGNDRLDGGKGNDLYNGGTGADTLVFSKREGSDRVKGFQNGKDKIEIDSGVTAFAQVKVTDKGRNTLLEFAGTKVLLIKTDHLDFDGSDFLFT